MISTYCEVPSAEGAASCVRETLRGCVGVATATRAAASTPVATTCSATSAPAATSAIVSCEWRCVAFLLQMQYRGVLEDLGDGVDKRGAPRLHRMTGSIARDSDDVGGSRCELESPWRLGR